MTSIDGNVVLVTGAGSGIGAASAISFAEAGADVVVTDIDVDAAASVADTLICRGFHALPVQLDVSRESGWQHVMDTVHERFGPVTVLHSNAAANSGAVMNRDLDAVRMDVEIWDLMMAVVLRGTMLGCKYVVPDMLDAGGSIIVTSSIKGLVGSSIRMAYSTAKGGLEQLVRSVATSYGRYGVRCNAVAPGIIETPGLREVVGDEYFTELEQAHLLPRTGRTSDIVDMVRYLASPAASYITGQTFVVDGGLSVHVPVLSPPI